MRKNFILLILIAIVVLYPFALAYSSWEAYKDVERINIDGDFKVGYIDVNGDFINEIIIEKQYGAGSNHYLEDLRIFKDLEGNRELELIFYIVTLDRTFGFSGEMKQYNCDIVSKVEFTDQTPENNGIRDIIVKSKKIYYKDKNNKIIDKEEGLGTKIFKWNGKTFFESVGSTITERTSKAYE
ncbi:hypothetical protein KJ830_01605 [bacterium]|nr:hypothetical protein [bacterium]